jgi:hypothetical protein
MTPNREISLLVSDLPPECEDSLLGAQREAIAHG